MSTEQKCELDCLPDERNPKIKVVKSCTKDHKKIISLYAPKPDGIDREQPGTTVFTTRMWMAKANQDLDDGSPSYAESYDQLEGSYPAKVQRVVGYHKFLAHDANGELTDSGLENYKKLVCGILESDIYKLDEVRGFDGKAPGFAGVNDATNGNIAGQSATGEEMPKAYREFTNEGVAEIVEDYLMAQNLDVPFFAYNHEISTAGTSLNRAKKILENPDVNKYLLQRSAVDGVYTSQNIFRDRNAGSLKGPYVSQFFYNNINGGASMGAGASWNHAQKYAAPVELACSSSAVSWAFTPGQAASLINGLTTEKFNGGTATTQTAATDNRARFVHSGRTLAAYVTEEPRGQRVYDASLIAARWNLPSNPGLGQPWPGTRDNNTNSHPSTPQVYSVLLSDMNNTLSYYWKYFRNRRVRPEVMGLYVHNNLTGVKDYGFPKWFIERNGNLKALWDSVADSNKAIAAKYKGTPDFDFTKNSSYTLPVQTRGGNPNHPCYPAGHAAAIAGMAALKFFHNCDTPLQKITSLQLTGPNKISDLIAFSTDLDWSYFSTDPNINKAGTPFYLEANSDGSLLYVKQNTDPTWTVNDEVDKLMCNFARAREWLGLHYRIDDNEGVKYSETAAYRILKDLISLWSQNRIVRDTTGKIIDLLPPAVSVTKYDGEKITVVPHFSED